MPACRAVFGWSVKEPRALKPTKQAPYILVSAVAHGRLSYVLTCQSQQTGVQTWRWRESRFRCRNRWSSSTGERKARRRGTLNGLMFVPVGTRTGLGLRTRRLQIRILPRVLEPTPSRFGGPGVGFLLSGGDASGSYESASALRDLLGGIAALYVRG
jgi:hypothetical protein